jgi:hypothetical protein
MHNLTAILVLPQLDTVGEPYLQLLLRSPQLRKYSQTIHDQGVRQRYQLDSVGEFAAILNFK